MLTGNLASFLVFNKGQCQSLMRELYQVHLTADISRSRNSHMQPSEAHFAYLVNCTMRLGGDFQDFFRSKVDDFMNTDSYLKLSKN